jgi:excinuclease ABC subunit A
VAAILAALDVLFEVGLGYLRLGQPTRALSGGERQRLLLATALLEHGEGPRLYLLDEPTVGLHAQDVALLLDVFGRLLDAGHTLVVVEHNLDLIRAADWVVDLGPGGGPAGGRIVAAGPLEAILACPESQTGRALAAPVDLA